jgi:2'-5' RNA ligase
MDSPSDPEQEQERRLFLALWPGESERQQMAELAVRTAGRRRVRDANLHLTLIFLGATAPDRLVAYEAALADLPIPALDLVLNRYGYWPQSRILWLGSSCTPPELYELVAELHRRLRGCGFVPERRAFQAHITVARRFTGPVSTTLLERPVRWRVNEVALIESLPSREGSRYEVLRRWPGG